MSDKTIYVLLGVYGTREEGLFGAYETLTEAKEAQRRAEPAQDVDTWVIYPVGLGAEPLDHYLHSPAATNLYGDKLEWK
jgi:hypothetical protein